MPGADIWLYAVASPLLGFASAGIVLACISIAYLIGKIKK